MPGWCLCAGSGCSCRLMLAPQGAEELTVEAFHTVVTECAAHAASVAADEDSGALARLAAIATSVQERTLELGKAFRETNRGAPVTLTQMVRSLLASVGFLHASVWPCLTGRTGVQLDLVRMFAPDLDTADCRLIVARMARNGPLDLDTLSLQDIKDFLRGVVFGLSHQEVCRRTCSSAGVTALHFSELRSGVLHTPQGIRAAVRRTCASQGNLSALTAELTCHVHGSTLTERQCCRSPPCGLLARKRSCK